MAEEIEGAEVTEYKLTPELLEAMVTVTEILEKLANGEITIGEAKALYEAKVMPVIKELQAKSKPASKAKKSTKKKSKSTAKSSSKSSRKRKTKKSG